ncbi:CDP-alcohol phosphatidyltransferase family protein [Pseudonocardia hispaniensis]|uniref:CDP-alcohol phosphatidyltransferase family protein n=1 Tax=Pseudonocardia hispaniensis TaxID=904933 RepID=A0ABW1J850_9PSEU
MTTVSRWRADQQQLVAAAVQVALLAALSITIGLGPVGWLAGVAYLLGLWSLLAAAARRARVTTFGPADLVTLGRAALVGAVTALVADGLWTGEPRVVPLVGIAAVAAALDAVDGQVARRSGTVSELGARFDMEVDSFLVLVLSVHVAALVGPWALVIGAMRYIFVAAGRVAPWLRSTLPPRYSAKAVAATTSSVLVVTAADILPRSVAIAVVATVLALLVWSFGQSVAWLWRRAHRPGRTGSPPQ